LIDSLIVTILVRPLMVALGLLGVVWGGVSLPIVSQSSVLERTAEHILDGDPFQVTELIELLPTIESIERHDYCQPASIRSAAIVRLRLFDEAFSAGDRRLLDEYMNALENSVRLALRCSPSDAFLWLTLYRVETVRVGFTSNCLNYLAMSYRLGPNEGWVALKRNVLAFSIYQQLPVDLQEASVNEFVGLVRSGFERETANILEGPGWKARDLLLPRLTVVSERNRQRFANVLYRDGFDVTIPGIPPYEPRPWR
jgi:hypothetical protein